MKKRNGFTLVELLAVIVILAIIMIISIPSVLNTLTAARQKTFGEFVTKVYNVAQTKYIKDGLLNGEPNYVKYDITKDLDMSSTGNYKGYVVFLKTKSNTTDVYIGISDEEYHTATKYGNNDTDVINYINYNLGGEPKFSPELSITNGRANYFVSGKTDDFSLTNGDVNEEELINTSEGSLLVPISSDNISSTNGIISNPEKDFLKVANEFFYKAASSFENDKNNANSPYKVQIGPKTFYVESTPIEGTNYIYTYPVNVFYPDAAEKNYSGYVIILHSDYPNASIRGIPITERQTYFAFKDANYHTITKVKGVSPSQNRQVVTMTYPLIQHNEYIYTSKLNLKRIDNLTTYDLTTAYLQGLYDYKVFENQAAEKDLEAFEGKMKARNIMTNNYQYFCANDNETCEIPDSYYNLQEVLANPPFDLALEWESERIKPN